MHAHRPSLGLALHAPPAAAGSAPRDQTRLKMRYVIRIGHDRMKEAHDTTQRFCFRTHWSRVLAQAARAPGSCTVSRGALSRLSTQALSSSLSLEALSPM